MSRAARALRIVGASALIAALGVPAVAAADPVAATVTITVPGEPIVCHVETEVSALVVDAAGATIAGKTVAWSLMPFYSSQDAVVEYETTTGSQGVATTKIWIDCLEGPRTLNAAADDVTASVDLAVSAVGMPETSTDAPRPVRANDGAPLVFVLVGAGLAGVAAFGLRARHAR